MLEMIAARRLPSWQSLALILLPSLESEPKQSYRNSGLISMGIHGHPMGTHGGGRGNGDLWGPRGDPVRTPQGPMENPWGPMGGAMGTHGDITRTHEGSPIVYRLIERTLCCVSVMRIC